MVPSAQKSVFCWSLRSLEQGTSTASLDPPYTSDCVHILNFVRTKSKIWENFYREIMQGENNFFLLLWNVLT